MAQRISLAYETVASAGEMVGLMDLLRGRQFDSLNHVTGDMTVSERKQAQSRSPTLRALEHHAGTPESILGTPTWRELTPRQLRSTATKATVGDLFHIATEVGSHLADVRQQKRINGWVGKLLSGSFDLEGQEVATKAYPAFYLT